MTPYEISRQKAYDLNLKIVENYDFGNNSLLGMIVDDYILLSNKLITDDEKRCVIEEEIAHYQFNYGNILDQTELTNKKQETIARRAAIMNVIPLTELAGAIVECGEEATLYNVSNALCVTEDFLKECIEFYEQSFSGEIMIGEYIVYFCPLRVYKRGVL